MSAGRRFALAAVCCAFLALPTQLAAYSGRWTASYDLRQIWSDGTAVHLMLMRGDGNPYHSRVVWLKGRTPGAWFGGEWGWKPASDACTSWPAASFTKLELADPEANIFCAGHTQLAEPGGRVLIVGGTESGSERGMRFAKILTPGTETSPSTWTTVDSMIEKRWYPCATTLKRGVLVTTGSKYGLLETWAGRKNGESSPSDEKLGRYGIVAAGQWDGEVLPSGNRPQTREGHTVAAAIGWGTNFYFGGRRSDGFLNDFYRLYRTDNPVGADYVYTWQPTPTPSPEPKPRPRFEHSAVVMNTTDMLVFGGRGSIATSGGHQVYGDLWRLWNDVPAGHIWKWVENTAASGAAPSARFGHTAIWDASQSRMLIFGGVGDTTSSASDNDVYALSINPVTDPNGGAWSKPQLVDGVKPPARFDHAMGFMDFQRPDPSLTGNKGTVAFLYGGRTSPGVFADTVVWALWSYHEGPHAGKIRWQAYSAGGFAPSPRAGHAMAQEAGTLINYVFGGINAAGTADDTVHAIDFENTPPTWRRHARRGATFTNHTMVAAPGVFARTPEFFTETAGANNDWTALTGSNLLQDWYGFNFVVPGAGGDSTRVFTAGPDDLSRYLTVADDGTATPWRRFDDGSGAFGGRWGSAVSYEPGKIMRCGTRDTGARGSAALDTTARIDVTVASPAWAGSADMAYSRVYHNLVMLPTGEVFATGGMGNIANDDDINPRQQPEIWNPAGNGGAGLWYGGSGADLLATDPLRRGYHSTALVLPDARILCAGGNHHNTTFDDLHHANIFCPPYLFRSDGNLAVRPVILTDPAPITWGQTFNLCVDNASPIQKVCLIRPGSTTHAFDQNQRYVPLGFSKGPNHLTVTSPPSGDHAPPGEYLLFVVGSTDGPSVPSIAKWIHLGPVEFDADDSEPPLINDLTPEITTPNSIMLWWTDPADDARDGSSGTARELLLRRASSHIATETTWGAATAVCGMPAPGPVDTYHEKTVTGLSCCQTYYFQLRARDDKPQFSAFHSAVSAPTLCYSGCGGSAAHQSRTEASTRAVEAPSAVAAAPAGPIVCETTELPGRGWQVRVRMGATWPESDAGLKVESLDDAGEWKTRGRFNEAGPYGLCGLRDRGRVVLNGPYRIERIATDIRRPGLALRLHGASHSRLGDVAAVLAAAGTCRLSPGDTLLLTYLPDAGASENAPAWFAVVRQGEGGALAAGAPAQVLDAPVPVRFALHQNEPNPFRGTTTIRFDLPRTADVRLEVFDLLGRRVRTLASETLAPGTHAVEWDQRDADGRRLGPGVYVYRLQAGEFRANRKMTLAP